MDDLPKNPSPARILICEDEGVVAEDIAQTLASLGYEVSGIASDCEEAVRLAEQTVPDLIIMDVKLQGEHDGIGAVQRIRSKIDVPVIYLTAYTERDILQRAKETEPYGYLTKPVTRSELRGAVDISLYKFQADQRVKQSEAEYRAILKTVMDGFCLLDTKGVILSVNDAYRRMCGYTEEELAGRTISKFVAHETPDEVYAHIEKIVSEGLDRFETVLRRKDGSLMQSEVSVQFLPYGRGKLFTFTRDITERKKAERELRQSEERLRSILDSIVGFHITWSDFF